MMDEETTTDFGLVNQANTGSEDAMSALYFRHRGWVYGLAMKFGANETDAHDVVQEVFRYFFGKFPGFKLTASLTTFLYPVVRNRVIDLGRKRQRDQRLTDELPEPTQPRINDDHNAAREVVLEMIADLPEFQRDVLLLRFVEELSLNQVAERLNLPPGTVKSRLHNALKTLRRLISIFLLLQ
jgi:RNA polymerase sigma factor (sigma-70 family)